MDRQTVVDLDLIFEVSRSHTAIVMNPLIAPSHGPLPDNTQHSKQTNIRAQRRIEARNSSKRAVVNPHLSTVLMLNFWRRNNFFFNFSTPCI